MKAEHDNSSAAQPGEPEAIAVRPVASDDWPLIEELFGRTGACGGCWCMHWHAPAGGELWERTKGETNKQALKALVTGGHCPAVLAIDGGRAVGWCRVGPAGGFERLTRSRKLWRAGMADWAVVCFFIERRRRGEGLSTRLLRAAAELAFASGARSVEGYAVVPKSEVMPAAFAWTGLPGTFERAGFAAVDHDSGSRQIYRLEHRPDSA